MILICYSFNTFNQNSLHIFGGRDLNTNSFLESTEIISEDGETSLSINLPYPLAAHAIASVNHCVSIIIGGETYGNGASDLTWYYNHITKKFTQGPKLLDGRRLHTAGTLIDQGTNEKVIVVAGGYPTHESVEFLINGKWRQGRKIFLFILHLTTYHRYSWLV